MVLFFVSILNYPKLKDCNHQLFRQFPPLLQLQLCCHVQNTSSKMSWDEKNLYFLEELIVIHEEYFLKNFRSIHYESSATCSSLIIVENSSFTLDCNSGVKIILEGNLGLKMVLEGNSGLEMIVDLFGI
ncbi:hypothetical protein Glove_87g278 [Diversispora epigaea]|uniref:Uncharacterized protein n=1 Tax=Diversispora epigaea TaxID=1348612 RepID=A0A397JD69_9GLOM|nr:hypothetical protein Glove_87g278 [Diversispora epigaea]